MQVVEDPTEKGRFFEIAREFRLKDDITSAPATNAMHLRLRTTAASIQKEPVAAPAGKSILAMQGHGNIAITGRHIPLHPVHAGTQTMGKPPNTRSCDY